MKNLIAFLISMNLCFCSVKSQIVYDFANMEDINSYEIGRQIPPVKNGEIVLIQIQNINTFLYKVEIDGKQIELQTPIPSELQNLFRLSADELDPEATEAQKGLGNIPVALKPMKILEKGLASGDPLKAQLNILIPQCEAYLANAKTVVEIIANVKYARMQLITFSRENLSFSNMQTKLASIDLPTDVQMKDAYEAFEMQYYRVEQIYESTEAIANTAQQEVVADAAEKIESGFELIEGEKILALYADVLTLKTGLENRKNFEITSPPIQMEGDMVSYKVTVTPTKINDLSPYRNPISWTVNIPAKGGWKADFSVGPSFSFGKNSKDDIFYLQKTETDSIFSLQQRENSNDMRPGLASMMHFYQRSGTNASYGLMLGVGAGFKSLEDVNLSYFLGGSIVLGKSRKIMISGGISYLKVARFKADEYEIGNLYHQTQINLADVTESAFKPSPFISVSYNLTNRVEIH